MVRRATRPPQWICGECMRVAEAIGCRTRVEVLQSADISSPFLCGLRRPLLLLPARMCDDSYCRDLPGIFAHELTHVRSHDVLWNVGLQLISIVLWFHPLVWRMRKAHLAACELVCDAVSASFVGDVTDYCRTLARVAVDVMCIASGGRNRHGPDLRHRPPAERAEGTGLSSAVASPERFGLWLCRTAGRGGSRYAAICAGRATSGRNRLLTAPEQSESKDPPENGSQNSRRTSIPRSQSPAFVR